MAVRWQWQLAGLGVRRDEALEEVEPTRRRGAAVHCADPGHPPTGWPRPTQQMRRQTVRITHRPSDTVIVEGPVGWGITPFEGSYYIRRRYLRTTSFRPNFIPGFCVYKFLYVWLDLHLPDGEKVRSLGWIYWLPNPIFPFIWYRVAVPKHHPDLHVEEL